MIIILSLSSSASGLAVERRTGEGRGHLRHSRLPGRVLVVVVVVDDDDDDDDDDDHDDDDDE